MNMNRGAAGALTAQESDKSPSDPSSPIGDAAEELMRAMNETERLVDDLGGRLRNVLCPPQPAANAIGGTKPTPEFCSPMVEGLRSRAAQIERTNAALREIMGRIEL